MHYCSVHVSPASLACTALNASLPVVRNTSILRYGAALACSMMRLLHAGHPCDFLLTLWQSGLCQVSHAVASIKPCAYIT